VHGFVARPFLHGRVFVFNEITILWNLTLVTLPLSHKAKRQYAVLCTVFSSALEFHGFLSLEL